jgi:hypothetical protein
MLRAQLEGPLQRIPKPFLHNQRPFVARSVAHFSYVHYEAGTVIVLYFISYVYSSPNHFSFPLGTALAR